MTGEIEMTSAAASLASERRVKALRISVPILALLAIAIGGASPDVQPFRGAASALTASGDCEAWDRAAATRIAAMIGENGALADLRLDEALAQLRRARKYCRSGYPAVAQNDYRALGLALAGDATGSIPTRPRR